MLVSLGGRRERESKGEKEEEDREKNEERGLRRVRGRDGGRTEERSEGGRKQPTTVVSMMLFTFCLWAESFKMIVKNPPPPAPAKEQPARSKQPDEVKGRSHIIKWRISHHV